MDEILKLAAIYSVVDKVSQPLKKMAANISNTEKLFAKLGAVTTLSMGDMSDALTQTMQVFKIGSAARFGEDLNAATPAALQFEVGLDGVNVAALQLNELGVTGGRAIAGLLGQTGNLKSALSGLRNSAGEAFSIFARLERIALAKAEIAINMRVVHEVQASGQPQAAANMQVALMQVQGLQVNEPLQAATGATAAVSPEKSGGIWEYIGKAADIATLAGVSIPSLIKGLGKVIPWLATRSGATTAAVAAGGATALGTAGALAVGGASALATGAFALTGVAGVGLLGYLAYNLWNKNSTPKTKATDIEKTADTAAQINPYPMQKQTYPVLPSDSKALTGGIGSATTINALSPTIKVVPSANASYGYNLGESRNMESPGLAGHTGNGNCLSQFISYLAGGESQSGIVPVKQFIIQNLTMNVEKVNNPDELYAMLKSMADEMGGGGDVGIVV